MIERLFARSATVVEDGVPRNLDATMIGIVCAHVSQVNAVRERLPAAFSDVLVETSDRFQELERHLMFVHHPLSGRADASAFHLEGGRLSVMMSRHRIACSLVGRAGISERLLRYAPSGDGSLGIDEDAEFEGWRAHLSILRKLADERRVLALQP
jgi:superfamily I DNA and/or RNA helicase